MADNGLVERRQPVHLRCGYRGEEHVDADTEMISEFDGGRWPTKELGEVAAGGRDAQEQFLGGAWYPHAPGGVPEMSFERADGCGR
ncbi:hypothetical protein GCM10027610_057420 [Dactylosporangium cerinum]